MYYPVPMNTEVDDGRCGRSDRTYARIFDLLTCHRIEDAVDLAEKAGLFRSHCRLSSFLVPYSLYIRRLATILSQADGDPSIPTLINSQLELWKCNGGETTIDPALLRIYRLLG